MRFNNALLCCWLTLCVQHWGVLAFVPGQNPGIDQQGSRVASTALFATISPDSVSTSADAASSSSGDAAESIEFPPPISSVDRLKRAATFWSTAVPIVANYYGIIGKSKLQELLGQKLSDEEMEVSKFICCPVIYFCITLEDAF